MISLYLNYALDKVIIHPKNQLVQYIKTQGVQITVHYPRLTLQISIQITLNRR